MMCQGRESDTGTLLELGRKREEGAVFGRGAAGEGGEGGELLVPFGCGDKRTSSRHSDTLEPSLVSGVVAFVGNLRLVYVGLPQAMVIPSRY
ncbi:unnamed protein product [Calypogeia fissa]